MKVIIESDKKPKENWLETLSISNDEFQVLLSKGVFVGSASQEFKCEFVGEIVTKRECIIALPKIYSNHLNYTRLDLMLTSRVLKKFYTEKIKQSSISVEEIEKLQFLDDRSSAEYEVFLSLKRYIELYGLYRSRIKKRTIGYNRKIDWKRTVRNSLALHSDGYPIYDNPENVMNDFEFNEVSVIFLSVYNYLESKYTFESGDYGSYEILPPNIIFAGSDMHCRKIQSELAKTFNTEDINILSLLNDYLAESLKHSGGVGVLTFGTSSFHVVWEELCSIAFRSDYHSLKEGVSQPVWKNGESSSRSKGKLRPDVLVEDEDTFYILDAKYYYPFPENHCGVGDIAKQYIYAKAFDKGEKSLRNGFLFPANISESIKACGEVNMIKSDKSLNENFSGNELNVFEVDYQSLAMTYLGRMDAINFLDELKTLYSD